MKILIISFSNIQNDPRVFRQVVAYANDHNVTTLGRGTFSYKNVNHIEVPKKPTHPVALAWRFLLLLTRQYKAYINYSYSYKTCISSIGSYDVVYANDVEALPLAISAKGNAKLIFDAHEYSPRQFENSHLWRLLIKPLNTYILKTYLKYVNRFLTVSEGIAQEYHSVFGKKPLVLTNASEYREADITKLIHQEKEEKIRLIHHGAANPGRKLDILVAMMGYLDDRYELTLMLMTKNNNSYMQKLKKMAAGNNVVFRPPVAMREIVPTLMEYDIGLAVFPPTTFNLKHVLPNKLFEFIQARLAIAIGPSKEMADLIQSYDIGVVAEDFSPREMARAIRSIDDKMLVQYRKNCDTAAREVNAENNIALLKSLV